MADLIQTIAKLSALYAVRSDSLHSWDRWMEVVTDAWPALHAALDASQVVDNRAVEEPADYHERHQVAEMAASADAPPAVPPDREALAREFTAILSPAIDPKAPYAKVMINRLVDAALCLPAGDAVREELAAARKEGEEAVLTFISNGRFLHDDAATARFAREVVAGWRSRPSAKREETR